MKLTFLGTGTSQGIPIVGCECDVCTSTNPKDQRLRSSAIIQSNDTSILIDTGPDLRQQLLNNKIDHIDAILYTHEHNDHVIGLDDIRPLYFKRKSNILSFALGRVHQELKIRFSYMFSDKIYPGVAQIDTTDIDKDTAPFTIGSIEVMPIGVQHGDLPILGYRFGKIAYITDASNIRSEELEKLQNLDIIIINALRRKKHHSHFTLDQAIDLINSTGSKKAYLTHLSHDMGTYNEISAELPKHIKLAYDTLTIEV